MCRRTVWVLLAALVLCLAGGCGAKNRPQQKKVAEPPFPQSAICSEVDLGQGAEPDSVYDTPVVGLVEDRRAEAARSLLPSHPLRKKWRRPIESAAFSRDRKTAALYDGAGVYLIDAQGRRIRRIRIILFEKLANEQLIVSFAFRPDSRRVAILTTLVYGEPMGAFIERLWTADVATGRARRLCAWADRVQGPGPITAERKLEGWTADKRSIIVSGVVFDGVEMPTDARRVGKERVVIKDKLSRRK